MNPYFKTLGQIEDRVTARMVELRQAERDVALHCSGMAVDASTAEEQYRAGLEHIGVSRRETDGMSVSALRILLKTVRSSQSSGGPLSPALAYDSKEPSVLDGILKGIKPPRDSTTRNELRRCL